MLEPPAAFETQDSDSNNEETEIKKKDTSRRFERLFKKRALSLVLLDVSLKFIPVFRNVVCVLSVLTDNNVRSVPCKVGPLLCVSQQAGPRSPVHARTGHQGAVHFEIANAARHALLGEALGLNTRANGVLMVHLSLC